MQQLHAARNGAASPEGCARALLAAVPQIMDIVRRRMRSSHQAELSVPQFRALVFINRHQDASVSEMAAHLGLSAPAISRVIEVLVKRGLVERQARADDRRSVALSLTARGTGVFRRAVEATERILADHFKELSRRELAQLSGGMLILSSVFALERPQEAVT